ncbi:hypothetical protein [Maribacter sp. 2304DJ31-5]|uniref:hypothetical protein n=1 Tax=Maribacter sp. 2304DJ31-5 TaxID=3386273 RepID=UPI0039BD1FFB
MELISNDIYEHTFQKVEVGIPAIPSELHTELIKMANIPDGESFLTWTVKVGEQVKEGTIIGKFNVRSISYNNRQLKANIKAPCNGRITKINPIEHTNWNWDTMGETVSEGVYKTKNRKFTGDKEMLSKSEIQFYIQPEVSVFYEERHIEDAKVHYSSRSLKDISEYAYVANTATGLSRTLKGIKGFKTIGDKYWRRFSDDVIAAIIEIKSS